MIIAILDKNNEDAKLLSNQICEDINPDYPLCVARFSDEKEMMDIINQKDLLPDLFFIDNESCSPLTLMFIKQKIEYPYVITISSQNQYHLNKCLVKPYQLKQVYTLLRRWYKTRRYQIKTINVKSRGGLHVLNIHDIVYIESYYRTIFVHTMDKTYEAPGRVMCRYENVLVHCGFISIQKSILINKDYVFEADVNQYTMKNNEVLYPSTRKKKKAFEKFKKETCKFFKTT